MDRETFLRFFVLFAVFFAANVSLILSGLNMVKAIELQNGLTKVFFENLKTDPISPVVSSVIFVFSEVVLPLLPFLALSVLSVVLVLRFVPSNTEIAAAVIMAAVLAFIFKPTVAMLLVSLGFLALIPITVEESKPFRTGYSAASSFLRYFSLFLCAAVFFGMITMPNFTEVAKEKLLEGIKLILPTSEEISSLQTEVAKSYIEKGANDVKNIVEMNFASLDDEKKQACSGFKESVISGIDEYKSGLTENLQTLPETVSDKLVSQLGIFTAIANSTPILSAISFFFLLELLRPVISALGGLLNLVIGRKSAE
ncbi:MAG: hypothetical protein GXO63_00615 [Candidatus Micrarchaeota archaeon]|nr:hypothetical protein [Candidatus Micrarchaeota archaeon]